MSVCFILAVSENCHECGATWKRAKHPIFGATYQLCSQCGMDPEAFRVRVKTGNESTDIRRNKKGQRLRSIGEAIKAQREINLDLSCNNFDRLNYRKKDFSWSDTFCEFIQDTILPDRQRFNLEERLFLEDFMAPYFAEVGVFVVSTIHLEDFIKTFRLKGEKEQMARCLFERVISQIPVAA